MAALDSEGIVCSIIVTLFSDTMTISGLAEVDKLVGRVAGGNSLAQRPCRSASSF